MNVDPFLYTLVLSITITSTCVSAVPCQKKYFNQSSFVCVCNSTHCDTIDADVSPPKGQVWVFSTSKDGDRFRRSNTRLKSAAAVPNDGVLIKVSISAIRQTIIGFGGTFTDAAGMNIADLPKEAQSRLINSYFSPEGIEYSLGRIPIASNDFSTDIYSYDFTTGDTGLSKFTISGYDHLYKLPYIDQAVVASRRNMSLFASPWSSPDWMKNTDNMVGNGTVASDMKKVRAEISTLWPFRYPLSVSTPIKIAVLSSNYWNDLPDSLITSAEMSEYCASLVRARD